MSYIYEWFVQTSIKIVLTILLISHKGTPFGYQNSLELAFVCKGRWRRL